MQPELYAASWPIKAMGLLPEDVADDELWLGG